MVHKKQSIAIYNIEDDPDLPHQGAAFASGNPGRKTKMSSYKVAPTECEVEERCELIKSTYDVISKYTRAMFDKQNETVV
ncbi:hypothetical protein MSG28_010464 [Choristoneura fumiferana]|uniref:Uncharacterized protein n=1 Tax=Choristoneura fumiferana TaxID=7141 RepID=A0ACC0KKZ9_CHOFU|nr:hypothetical protein MSG28_010464 [Choristoneura fumiferana]